MSPLQIAGQQILLLFTVNGVFVPLCEGVTVTCLWRGSKYQPLKPLCEYVCFGGGVGTLYSSSVMLPCPLVEEEDISQNIFLFNLKEAKVEYTGVRCVLHVSYSSD